MLFPKITLAKYQTLVLSVEEWRVTETNLQLHRWLLWLRRKTEVWWLLLDQQKLVILLLFPLVPFYFSVSDSCSILSSSCSSCFLIFSSSAWACAESSMARRRSVSGLEADMELEGLEVSPYSTSAPSGMLLEWRVGKKYLVKYNKKNCLKRGQPHPFFPTCHSGFWSWHQYPYPPRSLPAGTQTATIL